MGYQRTPDETEVEELTPHAFVTCEQVGLFENEICRLCGVLGCHRLPADPIHTVGAAA